MYYDYGQFLQDCSKLKATVEASGFAPDSLLYIARGGLTLAHFLSMAWDLRNVYSINAVSYTPNKTQHDLILSHLPKLDESTRRVLILDDIVDTGASLGAVLVRMREEYPRVEFKSACLFQKGAASVWADFYVREALEWIDFFWEVDLS